MAKITQCSCKAHNHKITKYKQKQNTGKNIQILKLQLTHKSYDKADRSRSRTGSLDMPESYLLTYLQLVRL